MPSDARYYVVAIEGDTVTVMPQDPDDVDAAATLQEYLNMPAALNDLIHTVEKMVDELGIV